MGWFEGNVYPAQPEGMGSPQEFGELIVDATPGGVGFDPAKLVKNEVWAKAVRCNLEGADIRHREDAGGAPTAAVGIPRSGGDEFWVTGEAAVTQFRAIRNAAPVDIEGLSREEACRVTWSAHGLQDGDLVVLSGIVQTGWEPLNGLQPVTLIDDNSFSLPVDTSNFENDYDPGGDPGQIVAAGKLIYTVYF
jgi:hypothetical protein